MIIIGYQGIGKTTLAGTGDHYIDLKSGCFWIDGRRSDDWYIPYCRMAMNISKQGNVVFVSSHEIVRSWLKEHNTEEIIVAIVPSLKLKEAWIEKLRKRYEWTGLAKDYKAWMNADKQYTENILAIERDFKFKEIESLDYNLFRILTDLENEENEKGVCRYAPEDCNIEVCKYQKSGCKRQCQNSEGKL